MIIMHPTLNQCGLCGKVRGELSNLCAACLKEIAAERKADQLLDDYLERKYHYQDCVADGDRELMDSVKAMEMRDD
jgi:hypothetical protein